MRGAGPAPVAPRGSVWPSTRKVLQTKSAPEPVLPKCVGRQDTVREAIAMQRTGKQSAGALRMLVSLFEQATTSPTTWDLLIRRSLRIDPPRRRSGTPGADFVLVGLPIRTPESIAPVSARSEIASPAAVGIFQSPVLQSLSLPYRVNRVNGVASAPLFIWGLSRNRQPAKGTESGERRGPKTIGTIAACAVCRNELLRRPNALPWGSAEKREVQLRVGRSMSMYGTRF